MSALSCEGLSTLIHSPRTGIVDYIKKPQVIIRIVILKNIDLNLCASDCTCCWHPLVSKDNGVFYANQGEGLAILSVLWFILFCLLCNRWGNTPASLLEDHHIDGSGPKGVIALSFFILVGQLALTFFCYRAHKAVNLLTAQCEETMPKPVTVSPSFYPDLPVNNYHGLGPNDGDIVMLDPGQPNDLPNLNDDPLNLNFGSSGLPSVSGSTMSPY